MIANYHTHTYRCNHATGNEEEYILAAIKAGLRILGFSEHAPYQFGDTGYYSTYRIPRDDAENYVNTLVSLREKYKNDIHILIGFEVEYYPLYFDEFLRHIQPLPYDYLLLGQHYLSNEIGEMYITKVENDIPTLTRYVDQCLEGLATRRFAYLAHPDIIRLLAPGEVHKKEMIRLLDGAKSLGIPAEINLLGVRSGRHYPSTLLFEAMAEAECDVIIGIDAHSPDAFLHSESIEFAQKTAARYGLHLIKTLSIPPRRPL